MDVHAFGLKKVLGCLAALAWLSAPASAAGGELVTCEYGSKVSTACGNLGCVLAEGSCDPVNLPPPRARGTCGPCHCDGECGGAKCDVAKGTCSPIEHPQVRDESVWPTFFLFTTSATLPYSGNDDEDFKPALAAGLMFEAAFAKTSPKALPDDGWKTENLPSLYWHVGGSAAMAAGGQSLLGEAGLSWYEPDWPLALTNIGCTGLVQRQGTNVLDLGDSAAAFTRIGPAVRLGFLYNIFLRVGWVFHVQGDTGKDPAVLVSVEWAPDLIGDVVPDRYSKYLPKRMR